MENVYIVVEKNKRQKIKNKRENTKKCVKVGV
jgi:hypothetical protein